MGVAILIAFCVGTGVVDTFGFRLPSGFMFIFVFGMWLRVRQGTDYVDEHVVDIKNRPERSGNMEA